MVPKNLEVSGLFGKYARDLGILNAYLPPVLKAKSFRDKKIVMDTTK